MSKSDNILPGLDREQRGKIGKIAKLYGVENSYLGMLQEGETGSIRTQGRPGSYNGSKGRIERRTDEDVMRDITNKMADGSYGLYGMYSGKGIPEATNADDIIQHWKDAKKLHKEIGGNNYNNASTDNYKLAMHAFGEWEDGLQAKTEEPEAPSTEPTQPRKVQLPRNVAQAAAAVDVFNNSLADGSAAEATAYRTRGEFAQKLKDQYVDRLTDYSGIYEEGQQPWIKTPDDQQDDGAVMPFTAPTFVA